MTTKKQAETVKKKQAEAVERLKKEQVDSEKELETTVHEFEIKEECQDKDGNPTKVLIIETDKAGFMGMFLELDNPFSADENNKPTEDGKKTADYLKFMSNIDIEENERAVGVKAATQARRAVTNFFMHTLVSSLEIVSETDEV